MEYVMLKHSDLKVSRLSMGGCPMGGHGWGVVDDNKLMESVRKAVDLGINLFDTADVYGLGKSEELLGKSIKGDRDKVIIATKFGVRVHNGKSYYDNSKEWIAEAIRESLKRLDTDYIDLYQIHYRDDKTPLIEIIECLDRLKEQGYIRYYGLSNIYKKDGMDYDNYKDKFTSFQNEFSLACRSYEKDIRELSYSLNLTPLTWGSLGQGILTGKYTISSSFDKTDRRSRESYINFHGDKLEKNLKIVEELTRISNELEKPIPAIAIRYILDSVKDSVALVGIKNEKQLYSNYESLGWALNDEHLERLDRISQ